MFKAASSAYRASLSETLASRGSGNAGGAQPPPPTTTAQQQQPRRPLSTQQQALLRQRRRHTLSGGGGGRSRNNHSPLLSLLAEACQSTACLTGLLLLGAAIVAFSLRGLYGAPAPLPGSGVGVGVGGTTTTPNLLLDATKAPSLTTVEQPPVASGSGDPHAPALPPGTTGEGAAAAAAAERPRHRDPGAPDAEAAPAPPPIHLDDALYAEAYGAAFPISPVLDDGHEDAKPIRRRSPRPHLHLRQRRLAQARLAQGLPPAGLATEDGADATPTAAPSPPLLSASVAVRAITGRARNNNNSNSNKNALPPASAVAVATFVSSEAQLEFALNWAAGLDAAGVDGGGEEDGPEAPAATGYLAVAATPELAARLADAGVPSAVFPTVDQARGARAEWEAAAKRVANGAQDQEEEEEEADLKSRIADVPTPLVAAEAAARGHPRVALARALLEFGFASALVTDPDVAWAAGGDNQQEDPRAYLTAVARQAKADALVGSNALSPGAGRSGLVDPGLDVPTALILGSSGVAELVQGPLAPHVPLGLSRNQTNAAASAAFGASRRLTDGLLDPGFLFLRRTPSAVAFVDSWCSVMAGKGEKWGGDSGANAAAQPPAPPVDSHAFNRLALEGWEPSFVPAPGTWSALNATAEQANAAAPANFASPSVTPGERALVGWRGALRLGVLPLASFPNGHAHFVQRVNDMAAKEVVNGTTTTTQPPPPLFAVRSGTHLFGGLAGKRHRLRDAGLWRLDGPEYFFGWDQRDLLANDEHAREKATLLREKEILERQKEREAERDAAAARASALAVAAGAAKGMGAGELAAKFFRPFSAGAGASSPAWASVMKRVLTKANGGGDEAEKTKPKKYVAFALPMAPDLPPAEFEALPGGAEEMAHYHAAGLALQREQLMAMVGVALALGRGLILPQFKCYCDRHWTMLHRCRVPGGGLTPLPFSCPQDHVAEPGKFAELGLLGEATPLEVREASFLTRSRPPGAAGARVLEIEPHEGVDGPREEWGVLVAATGECRAAAAAEEEGKEQEQQQQRCLRRVIIPLDTAQGVLRRHLQPYAEQYDVLRFSTPLRVLRSFDSPEAAAAAARRIAHLRGSDTGAGLPASATSGSGAAARRRRRRAAIAAATAKAKEEEALRRQKEGGGGGEAAAAAEPPAPTTRRR